MSTIEELENRLVASIVRDDTPFRDAVDSLLSFLISGGEGRPTDGVILAYEDQSNGQASGCGIFILVEGQFVDAFKIVVTLNESQTALISVSVLVSVTDREPAKYGSKEHQRMVKEIVAHPECKFPWKRRFHRDENGWSSSHA